MKRVITATRDDERVFYSIDDRSGGYPFWSTNIRDAEPFSVKHLKEVQKDFRNKKGYSYVADVTNLQITEITFNDEPIDISVAEIDELQEVINRIPKDDMDILIKAGIFK